MIDLRRVCSDLRALAREAPSDDARAELAKALTSKWAGVRSVAAQTLKRWPDATTIDLLQRWLERDRCNDSVGVHALLALEGAFADPDYDWLFAMIESEPERTWFSYVVHRLGPPVVPRIERLLAAPGFRVRELALGLVVLTPVFPEPRRRLLTLPVDETATVRDRVTSWLAYLDRHAGRDERFR